jgi:hypothetical protein
MISVTIGGRLFATYDPDGEPRPHVVEVLSVAGQRLTRSTTPGGHPEGSDDHPHHKGVWWGHRSVNGADVWTEFPGHGRIVRRGEVRQHVSDTVHEIAHDADWLDADGAVLLGESRILRAHAPLDDGSQALDLDATLTATAGTVKLADTKEAGLVAVRVNPAMEERRGGRIETSTGAVGEAAAWGTQGTWCDYSGVVDGDAAGIAVFDHPENPRHPTFWHVRDYGLLAANPFGWSDFLPDLETDGAMILDAGESVRFRYRLLTHRGDAAEGRVAEHYTRYVAG